MEPSVRIELTTYRLQGGCSATELQGHVSFVRSLGIEPRDLPPNRGVTDAVALPLMLLRVQHNNTTTGEAGNLSNCNFWA